MSSGGATTGSRPRTWRDGRVAVPGRWRSRQRPPAPERLDDQLGIAAGRPLLLCAMLLAAVNMRPALAEVGPLVRFIRADMRLSGAELALLTALPVICFGMLAPLAPGLARRLGLEQCLLAALAALAAGMAMRLGPGLAALLSGTIVLGSGIALINVLLPALVKRDFSRRAGLVTGLYTTALNLAAALAAGTAVPLAVAAGGSWRSVFAIWIAPVITTLAVWVPLSRRATPPLPSPAPAGHGGASMAGNRRTRQIIVFTAAQSVIYYSVLSWLPSIYESHGLSAAAGGLMLSVTTLVSAPVALVLPSLAARRASQRGYAAFVAGCAAAGLLGLLAAPATAPYLWAVLLGIGQGGAFPLALTLFVLRTSSPAATARLSTTAQSTAYIIAAGGPLALGMLHDATGSWTLGVALLAVLAAVELAAGLGAGRPGRLDTAESAGPGEGVTAT